MQGGLRTLQRLARTVIQHDALDRAERGQLDLLLIELLGWARPVEGGRVEAGNQQRRRDGARRRPDNPGQSLLSRRPCLGERRFVSRQQCARPRPVDSHCPGRIPSGCLPVDSVGQQGRRPPLGRPEPPCSTALHLDGPLSARRTKHMKGTARNGDSALFVCKAGRPAVGVNQHRRGERPACRTLIVIPAVSNQLELDKRPLAGLQAHFDQPAGAAPEVGRQVPGRTDRDLKRPWRCSPLADRIQPAFTIPVPIQPQPRAPGRPARPGRTVRVPCGHVPRHPGARRLDQPQPTRCSALGNDRRQQHVRKRTHEWKRDGSRGETAPGRLHHDPGCVRNGYPDLERTLALPEAEGGASGQFPLGTLPRSSARNASAPAAGAPPRRSPPRCSGRSREPSAPDRTRPEPARRMAGAGRLTPRGKPDSHRQHETADHCQAT